VKYSQHFAAPGAAFLQNVCALGLEGMISKRADLPYRPGRSPTWQKIKCVRRQEMVIGGFTDPEGSRDGFGALLLGVYEPDGRLTYSGKVGTGFTAASLASLHRTLTGLVQEAPPFHNPPRGAEARRAHWVKPVLVAEVTFTEWTDDGTLRHPSFQGLRSDKPAKDVVREREAVTSKRDASNATPAKSSSRAKATIEFEGRVVPSIHTNSRCFETFAVAMKRSKFFVACFKPGMVSGAKPSGASAGGPGRCRRLPAGVSRGRAVRPRAARASRTGMKPLRSTPSPCLPFGAANTFAPFCVDSVKQPFAFTIPTSTVRTVQPSPWEPAVEGALSATSRTAGITTRRTRLTSPRRCPVARALSPMLALISDLAPPRQSSEALRHR